MKPSEVQPGQVVTLWREWADGGGEPHCMKLLDNQPWLTKVRAKPGVIPRYFFVTRSGRLLAVTDDDYVCTLDNRHFRCFLGSDSDLRFQKKPVTKHPSVRGSET